MSSGLGLRVLGFSRVFLGSRAFMAFMTGPRQGGQASASSSQLGVLRNLSPLRGWPESSALKRHAMARGPSFRMQVILLSLVVEVLLNSRVPTLNPHPLPRRFEKGVPLDSLGQD